MPYETMVPKSTGDIVGDTDWNQIVDNFAAGVPDIFTAAGDLVYAAAANEAARLAVGTAGQVLTVDTDLLPSWKTPGLSCVARYVKASATALGGASTDTAIVDFDTADFDTDSAVTTGASWSFQAPAGKDGTFLVVAHIALADSTTWNLYEGLQLDLYKNGALYALLGRVDAQGTDIGMACGGATIVQLSGTDYIDVRATQTSGGAINILGDTDLCHVSIARLFS